MVQRILVLTVITMVASPTLVYSQRMADDSVVLASHSLPVESGAMAGPSQGALFLCGGGDLSQSLLSAFFQSGQGEEGRLVVIPSASRFADNDDTLRWRMPWVPYNWKSVDIVHAKNREDAERDEMVEPLRRATAIWITGGDQSRLSERYSGSRVEREIQSVLHRGGVVGGTSAGSAIATKIMIAGGQRQPILHQGLDLLPRAIVDQHFSQRSRHLRLASAIAKHPERVGIGIDEGTALHVTAKSAQVLGQGAVHVYRCFAKEEIKTDDVSDHFDQFDQRVYNAGSLISMDDLPLLTR